VRLEALEVQVLLRVHLLGLLADGELLGDAQERDLRFAERVRGFFLRILGAFSILSNRVMS
jgi:hypothetical protein